MALPIFHARRDFKLRARVVGDRPLVYSGPATDGTRPDHVRAGSGLAWTGERMVVVQDDADYIAVIDEGGGSVTALPIRSGSGAGAPKARTEHLELEAVLSAKDWRGEFLLAFGSGLTDKQRHVARMRLSAGDTEMSVFETRKLYQAVEDIPDFATTEINIEGVALIPRAIEGRDAVRLFHRAVGPPRCQREHHYSGTVDLRLDSLIAYLDRCKRDPNAFLGFDLHEPRRYDLDEFEGAPFTFTDAAPLDGGRVAYIAIAEKPGEAQAVALALGVIEADGSARYTMLVEKDGSMSRRRAEGMVMSSPSAGFLVVQDSDEGPATLANVDVVGL